MFLFVTANKHEREAFEAKFIRHKEDYILGKTYYLGEFGCYPAAYIHMEEQGVTNPAAMPLVGELVRKLQPVSVVMVGIAFGTDEGKQKIGDVLVSDKILPYDSAKLLEDRYIYKEIPKEVGFQLLNAFREYREWNYILPNSMQSVVHIGSILTGSKLINNYEFRLQLLRDFADSKPIGGEMEAQGIYSISRLHGISEWIIIKAICDWGYNKNNPNKERDQEIAANAAVDYCYHVFSRSGVFDSLVEKHNEKDSKEIIHVNCVKKVKDLFSDDDPVVILINKANDKSVTGDYAGALYVAQEALKIAEEINKNDEIYFLRVAYAKLQCVMKMHQIPEWHNAAINFISDILKMGVFDEFSGEMFLLYYHLADISISTNDFSTARAAIEKAEPLSQDDYDAIRCEAVKGKIAMCEGRHDDAIYLLKKMVDTLNLKLVTKGYEDTEECYMIEQNLAATLNDIAIAYRNKGDLQCAMIYVKRAVDTAETEFLEHERAVFLDHWADMLIEDGLFDSAIEKATMAQEIFKKRNEMSKFVHACELLGVAYFRQGNLTLSCKSYLDAFDAVEKVEGKLYFSQKIAQLSAKLGDEKLLNEQIEFIGEFQKFDDDNSLSMFEKWAKDLQIVCSNVLPNDFKDQPETFFMFDEEDPNIIEWRKKLIEIGETSHDVTERDERVLAYLMHYSEEISKKKKDNVNSESELKKLRSKLSDSKFLSEKAQLMYEIGGWYYLQHNDEEADIWILKAMNAEGASKHTVIWSKITHAQVLMNRCTIEDDNEAKVILDEVIDIVEVSKRYEAIAFCEFNRGRLEARKGNFKYALSLLKKAYRALDDGQIENKELRKDIKEKYFDINQYLHFEDNPTEDLPSLQSELLFLQTWYPKYSQQLSEYWWYYRANEPLNNIRILSSSACVIFSEDIHKIYWYSEALRFLFAHCMYAPKESWQNMQHIVNRTIPVPYNTPFPYSRTIVKNKKVDGKLYGYNQQVDGSERVYAYKQLQDEVSFDKNRIPEPITLSYLGYHFPDLVSKIVPTVDEFGSCRWWIGAEFGGSPDALMNLVSRFGIVPVFCLNDINQAKNITILRSERIDIPFNIGNQKTEERTNLQKRLSYMTSISEQIALYKEFDEIIEYISKLPQGGFPPISIHLVIVRFGYHVWSESPVQWRVYPVVMIDSEDEWRNSENDSAVTKSIAIRDTVCLMQKISAYAHHPHDVDEYYIRKDALTLLELSKCINDETIEKCANRILTALDELSNNKCE